MPKQNGLTIWIKGHVPWIVAGFFAIGGVLIGIGREVYIYQDLKKTVARVERKTDFIFREVIITHGGVTIGPMDEETERNVMDLLDAWNELSEDGGVP